MRVKILMDVSDHLRGYQAEEEADLPDDQAKRWVEAGYAIEAAAVKAGDEKATQPKAEKRG